MLKSIFTCESESGGLQLTCQAPIGLITGAKKKFEMCSSSDECNEIAGNVLTLIQFALPRD